MIKPMVQAKWKGTDYNTTLEMKGDLHFKYPDRAGGTVCRILSTAVTDDVLLAIKRAGYDVSTLRISVSKLAEAQG